ncbi:MAG TPA: hypothetical protein VHL11_07350, partial [Phototrophicaceae bacterium]|nr:hypothetical protein [Phototrophicaceae bacterium]
MKLSIKSLLQLAVVSLWIIIQSVHIAAQTTQVNYLYGFINQDNTLLRVSTLDPLNPTFPKELATFSIQPENDLYGVQLSPDNQWIAIALKDKIGDFSIKLLNLDSLETRDVVSGLETYPVSESNFFALNYAEWSPDSNYLAYSQISNSNGGIDNIYLYSLADNEITPIFSDSSQHEFLDWSHDSNYLVVDSAGFTCPEKQNTCYEFSINLYDVRSKSLSYTIDLTPFPIWYGTICKVNWSPDDLYISFVAGCDNTLFNTSKEVYLFDTGSKALNPITHFTPEDIDHENLIYGAFFEPVWWDNNHLLISVNYDT